MKIFIPSHLESSLPIVKQLADLVRGYTPDTETIGSFDFMGKSDSIDPVKRFIELCLPGLDSGVSSYLVKLFYSVKGSLLVFSYMEKHLGIKFKTISGDGTKIIYTINGVEFIIEEVETTDMALWLGCLREFLDALLYFGRLDSIIKIMTLRITDDIPVQISGSIQKYQEYTAKEYIL